MTDWVYDMETYPNVFTLAIEHADAPIRLLYEISDWRDDNQAILQFLRRLANHGDRMVGFNNLGFDYPVLHLLIRMGRTNALTLYRKAQSIITAQTDQERWAQQVYPSDRYIAQIDLFKIHHFDNRARSTSLKALEFNMRLNNISDLPFDVGTHLTREQVPVLREYNREDVSATKRFYHESIDQIRFREELMVQHPDKDWLNFNDTKIGKQFFTIALERAGVACYEYNGEGRQPRQTRRELIDLNHAILPSIRLEHPALCRVLNRLREQVITETRGVFKDMTALVNGFEFVFGLGGVHGSVDDRVVESDDDHAIIDLDVSSYYPNLAIAGRFYPEHLGERFCDIYRELYERRKHYPKGTTENAMLKLALNGVYGDSNNPYSVFYDPMFTMKITLNGQLLLSMLAEQLMQVDTLEMIQINTDGLTVRLSRHHIEQAREVWQNWERNTGLTLERADYARMYIRDVNSYIAEYVDGKVKRKGAYDYDVEWHQNASALVVPKVAEKVLLEDAPIRHTVENWPDRMDFMLRVKVPRNSYLSLDNQRIQNTTRYYIARGGGRLIKWMPPTPKMRREGKNDWRQIGVNANWQVCVCNSMNDATLPIDYDYYVEEVEKLCMGLM